MRHPEPPRQKVIDPTLWAFSFWFGISPKQFDDCLYFKFTHFCPTVIFTLVINAPATSLSIFRVIKNCTNSQMIRIYAARVVARVKDKKPFGDFTFMQFV